MKPAKKKAAKKRKAKSRGRPKFKITKAVCNRAKKLASQGLTLKQIALVLGISYQTLNEKSKEYSDFSDAIEQGYAKGVADVTSTLFKKAKSGDVGAIKYYLNNRDNPNWKDRVDNTISGPDGGPIDIKVQGITFNPVGKDA